MSARRRSRVQDRPAITPRLLMADDAAAYLSLPVAAFLRLGVGRVQVGSNIRFDRFELDRWLDDRHGNAPESSPPSVEDDADEALARFANDFERAPRRA